MIEPKARRIAREARGQELADMIYELINPTTRVQKQAKHVEALKKLLKRARSTNSKIKWTDAVYDQLERLDDIKKHVKLGTMDQRTNFVIGVMKGELLTLGLKLKD